MRDAARLQRERQVESALADFYEQTGRVEHLRATAQSRAEKVLAEAEAAALEPERLAREAVAALAGLGEPRDQIAELTGLPLADVRGILSEVAGAGRSRGDGRGAGLVAASVPESEGEVAGSGGVRADAAL
ncbi:hypothetical protein Kpho01_65840 [Kitasatospora phosalacinea]|uniref:Uncharacterized protein n=1 Tax=Kitasatospora phosalacinea TaxID=2065 RepID=A0A9W6USG5_9ACTN|nr:hypothetical protein Kpho01_65840 [Kitasatospora phosalacinea]